MIVLRVQILGGVLSVLRKVANIVLVVASRGFDRVVVVAVVVVVVVVVVAVVAVVVVVVVVVGGGVGR